MINEKVVPGMGLLSQEAHGVIMRVSFGHDLIEDVVVSFDFQLERDSRFLQEISLDVGRGDLQVSTEVNTDELAL